LLAGRAFLASDDANGLPVTIINQSLARRFWPAESPLGKRIDIGETGAPIWLTVVGIVGDVHHAGLDDAAEDAFYVPFLQYGGVAMNLFVRTTGEPILLPPALRKAVHEIDPEQSISDISMMEQIRSDSIAPMRLTATLLSLLGLLAFAITVAGLNGVIAYSTTEQTQEIGIRAALGARRTVLLHLVMRQGMALVLLGLALGWAGALGGGKLLASRLFGVEPSDPVTFLLASLALLVCGGAACFFPARRAAFTDPMVALRS